jgi:hypothetical protein
MPRYVDVEDTPAAERPSLIQRIRQVPDMVRERRGAGDVAAILPHIAGVTPCGGCKERQARWNERWPSNLRQG